MCPVSSPSFAESVYANLPAKSRKELAEATGKRSAACSARQLYGLLGDPRIVEALPPDEFKGRINKSGKIKLWSRLMLAIRHFYYALFSQFDKLGKAFAELIPKKGRAGNKAGNQKPTDKAAGASSGRTNRKAAAQSGLGREFATNVGVAAVGNIIGNVGGNLVSHAFSHKDKEHPAAKHEPESVDGGDDKTGKHASHPAEQDKVTHERDDKEIDAEKPVDDGDKAHTADARHDLDDAHDEDDSDADVGDDDEGGGGFFSRFFGHHGASGDDDAFGFDD